MTNEFFSKIAKQYLVDDEVKKLWDARPKHIDKEPEDFVTAMALTTMCQLHARQYPEVARKEAA